MTYKGILFAGYLKQFKQNEPQTGKMPNQTFQTLKNVPQVIAPNRNYFRLLFQTLETQLHFLATKNTHIASP
jgi:hypothetical protein